MPKTKEELELLKTKRKESILQAALYVFAMNGYEGTSFDVISKKANCSHGLLYHYYPHKEALWFELFELKIKPEVRQGLENIDYKQSPDKVLNDLIKSCLQGLKSTNDDFACVLYLLLNLHLQKSILPKPKNPAKKRRIYDVFYDVIVKGQEQGLFYNDNPKELIIAILSQLKGLAFNRINLGPTKFICPGVETLTRMIVKGEEHVK